LGGAAGDVAGSFPRSTSNPVHYPGAFGATCHNGVTLAGAHAVALAPVILQGALPDELSAFASSRFRATATG